MLQLPNAMLYLSLLLFAATVLNVNGHGRLLEPPSRGSLFRFRDDPIIASSPNAKNIKPNYNDNQLFCGGVQTQIANGGKCGVCGDPYRGNKPHEAGGKYGLGIITRYYEVGQTITLRVQITAQHRGYFEFRLCPWNNPNVTITHECLNRHLLQFEDNSTKWYLPSNGISIHTIMVQLPEDISCTQCVLQWRYRTGNSWGSDENGRGLGYGQQEEFYGCSDVAVGVDPPEKLIVPASMTPPSSRPNRSQSSQSPTVWTQPASMTPPSSRPNRSQSSQSPTVWTQPASMTPPSSRPNRSQSSQSPTVWTQPGSMTPPSSRPNRPQSSQSPTVWTQPASSSRPRPRPTRTPRPTQGTRPTRRPRPTQGTRPTRRPRPTQGTRPTRRPRPTQGTRPTRRPRPTQGTRPTRRPRPTQGTRPTRRPRPTQGTRPTRTPRPTRRPRPKCRRRDFDGRHKCLGCDNFYRCIRGYRKPVILSCPAGTACKPNTGHCVHRYQVQRCSST